MAKYAKDEEKPEEPPPPPPPETIELSDEELKKELLRTGIDLSKDVEDQPMPLEADVPEAQLRGEVPPLTSIEAGIRKRRRRERKAGAGVPELEYVPTREPDVQDRLDMLEEALDATVQGRNARMIPPAVSEKQRRILEEIEQKPRIEQDHHRFMENVRRSQPYPARDVLKPPRQPPKPPMKVVEVFEPNAAGGTTAKNSEEELEGLGKAIEELDDRIETGAARKREVLAQLEAKRQEQEDTSFF
ncbi:unnamed protein product [Amoebophrya sp. A25]|nr:unnamed protein product [Amoebophrya sp. A25]|eukprot:GSA25T00002821001.1